MASSDASRDVVLERLAAEFVERHRCGECPPLTEYTARYPDLADDIRALFPAIVQIEQLKPVGDDLTGPFGMAVAGRPRLERLGEYRLLREVGRGGMGVVYEAEQESLGRHVALKVLPPHALLNSTYLERFRREARAAAKLHHTNIVPVFGVGEADGVPYYAMQFIRGEGLDKVLADLRRLRTGGVGGALGSDRSVAQGLLSGRFADAPTTAHPAEPTESMSAPQPADASPSSTLSGSPTSSEYHRSVAQLGVQVAEALAYAHNQGILHRDVKPSNLLLDAQGRVWISDFGLAKAEGTDELTQTGDIVGTLRFMAPERFNGRSLPQSDIYALGLTLFELLTLQPAFDDTNKAQLIEKVLHQPPPSLRKLDARIPRDLETIVLKCIAKDPADRYTRAEALADDLGRFLADRPIRARRSSTAERLGRWCRRNPAVATLSGALLTLLLVTAVGGVVMSFHLLDALGHAQDERDKARAAQLQEKKKLFASLVSEARAQRFSGRAGQRFGTLDSIRSAAALARELEMPASTFDELRDLAIAALALPDVRLAKEWDGWPEGSLDLAFDATREHYARADTQGNVTVRQIADDVEVAHRAGNGNPIRLGGFEEDGHALLLLDPADKSMKRWRFGADEAVPLGKQPALFAQDESIALTTDRQLLVSVQRQTGVVAVHDFVTGKHLRDIRFGKWVDRPQPIGELVWDVHPWRHEVAVAMGMHDDPERTKVRILDLDRGTVAAELIATPIIAVFGQMAWHPDGRTLAIAYAHSVRLWDVPARKAFSAITGHKGGGLNASISRSGQLMSTFSSWAGAVKFWHPHTGKLLLYMPNLSIHPTAPSPDGRMYTHRVEGQRVQLWATEPSPVLRVLVRSPARGQPVSEYRGTAVHRGGRLLAVGSAQGVSLFDLAGGIDVGHLDLGFTLSVRFDPANGDLLTAGARGLQRWPVRLGAKPDDAVTVGPPQRVRSRSASDNGFALSGDGKVLAIAEYQQATVLAPGSGKPPVIIKPLGDCRHSAVSPDGRWVATAMHGGWPSGRSVEVWDARTGVRVAKLPVLEWSQVRFSPDGRWLFARNMDKAGFWRTGTWEKALTAPRGTYHDIPAFDPDGRLVAYERGDGAFWLVNADSGQPLAALENTDQGRSHFTTFAPDGTTLIATNMDTPAINVWDLRALRQRLAELDLDWAGAPYSPADRGPPALAPRPLEVRIDLGHAGKAGKQR